MGTSNHTRQHRGSEDCDSPFLSFRTPTLHRQKNEVPSAPKSPSSCTGETAIDGVSQFKLPRSARRKVSLASCHVDLQDRDQRKSSLPSVAGTIEDDVPCSARSSVSPLPNHSRPGYNQRLPAGTRNNLVEKSASIPVLSRPPSAQLKLGTPQNKRGCSEQSPPLRAGSRHTTSSEKPGSIAFALDSEQPKEGEDPRISKDVHPEAFHPTHTRANSISRDGSTMSRARARRASILSEGIEGMGHALPNLPVCVAPPSNDITPRKPTSCEPLPENESSIGGQGPLVVYLEHSDLEPLPSSNLSPASLSHLVQKLGNADDWQGQFSALSDIRRLSKFHPCVLLSSSQPTKKLGQNTLIMQCLPHIISNVDNLRSNLSKNAVLCAGDLFRFIGSKGMGDSNVFPPLFSTLVRKAAGAGGQFIIEESERACKLAVLNTSPQKTVVATLNALWPSSKSHAKLRARCGDMLGLLAGRMGHTILSTIGSSKDLYSLLAKCSQGASDAALETRRSCRIALYLLDRAVGSSWDMVRADSRASSLDIDKLIHVARQTEGVTPLEIEDVLGVHWPNAKLIVNLKEPSHDAVPPTPGSRRQAGIVSASNSERIVVAERSPKLPRPRPVDSFDRPTCSATKTPPRNREFLATNRSRTPPPSGFTHRSLLSPHVSPQPMLPAIARGTKTEVPAADYSPAKEGRRTADSRPTTFNGDTLSNECSISSASPYRRVSKQGTAQGTPTPRCQNPASTVIRHLSSTSKPDCRSRAVINCDLGDVVPSEQHSSTPRLPHHSLPTDGAGDRSTERSVTAPVKSDELQDKIQFSALPKSLSRSIGHSRNVPQSHARKTSYGKCSTPLRELSGACLRRQASATSLRQTLHDEYRSNASNQTARTAFRLPPVPASPTAETLSLRNKKSKQQYEDGHNKDALVVQENNSVTCCRTDHFGSTNGSEANVCESTLIPTSKEDCS